MNPTSEKSQSINWGGILPELLNSEDRRASRLTWWRYILSLCAINILLTVLAQVAVTTLDGTLIGFGLAALVLVLVLWAVAWTVVIFFVVSIRRWHDLDRRGEWCFIIFVPIIGQIWFLVAMGFRRGTAGDNNYGREV